MSCQTNAASGTGLGWISSRFVRPRSFAHTTAGSLVCPIVFSTNQRLACTNRAGKYLIGQFSLVNNKDGGYLCGKILPIKSVSKLFKIGKFGKNIKKHQATCSTKKMCY